VTAFFTSEFYRRLTTVGDFIGTRIPVLVPAEQPKKVNYVVPYFFNPEWRFLTYKTVGCIGVIFLNFTYRSYLEVTVTVPEYR
jgi:hypothetical protein